jgi:phosphate-selective porin OprO and OprP
MRKTALLAACLMAAATMGNLRPLQAQTGLYYMEVVQDGRVYVFNTPERYKAFVAGGEMGTAITLIGLGEGGATVVAETENAADLYFFKHNLPGWDRATPKPQKSFDERIFYKDGKTNIVMKTGTVQISNRVQGLFTQVDPPTGDSIGSFRIRRMKTTIEGSAYEGIWKFKLQANWVGGDVVSNVTQSGTTITQTRSRGPILEDASIFFAKYPLATIMAGQDKAYFGRQELISSGRQQFVDRSITSGRFAASRQIGLGLFGVNADKTFEYNLGIYNGNGINQTTNDNKDYLTVGRAVWTPFGEYKLEESAHDYPTTPKLFLGGSVLQNTTGTGTSKTDIDRLGFEAGFKILGFNAIGEYYTEESQRVNAVQVDTDGYYAQVGYLFPNKKFELAGRLAEILPDTVRNTDQTETGIAASWYFDKHGHKLQADYRDIENKALAANLQKSKEFRLQLQLIF